MARARGRIRPQNLSHLIDLSHARHGLTLKLGLLTITPPASWDSPHARARRSGQGSGTVRELLGLQRHRNL